MITLILAAYIPINKLRGFTPQHCKKKALVEASNPAAAAYQTFAHAVYPVDEMGEDEAVFWDRLPIQDPPVYSGSTIDCDFPDDMVCGMYLPCPGTDGKEYLK